MLKTVRAGKFRKEVVLAQKRGKDMEKLRTIILKLASGEPLDAKNKDHPLKGNYNGYRECHIEPDWLLVYAIDEENNELWLYRTGSHSDLFD